MSYFTNSITINKSELTIGAGEFFENPLISLRIMMVIIGILMIGTGYIIFYTVPPDASFEYTINCALTGIILNLLGSALIVTWLVRRSK